MVESEVAAEPVFVSPIIFSCLMFEFHFSFTPIRLFFFADFAVSFAILVKLHTRHATTNNLINSFESFYFTSQLSPN
jgi:hypothetical protein